MFRRLYGTETQKKDFIKMLLCWELVPASLKLSQMHPESFQWEYSQLPKLFKPFLRLQESRVCDFLCAFKLWY